MGQMHRDKYEVSESSPIVALAERSRANNQVPGTVIGISGWVIKIHCGIKKHFKWQ